MTHNSWTSRASKRQTDGADCNYIFEKLLFLKILLIRVSKLGGFHLVDLIITELEDHMTCCKFECSHW